MSTALLTLCLAAALPQTAVSADPTAELQAQLDAFTALDAVPGACLAVSFDDGRLLACASGFADPAAAEAMTVEHRLMSGSIGKTYFAAWYFDLLEEGVVGEEDLLGKYLGEEDWYPRLPNHDSITLRQLMRHQSGIPEHVHLEQFWEDARADVQRVWRPQELVAYILDAEPLFEAGSDWSYADTWDLWEPLYPHGMALHEHAQGLPVADRISLLDSLARHSFGKARFEESVLLEQEAFDLAEEHFGEASEETNDRFLNYGESLRSLDRYEEAEAVVRRSLEWETKKHGRDHIQVANALNYLGLLLREKEGSEEEGERCFKEGLEICDRIGVGSGRAYVKLLGNLAMMKVTEAPEECEALARRALEQARSEWGEENLLTQFAGELLGVSLNNLGKIEESEPYLRQASEVLCRLLGDFHKDSIGALRGYGRILSNLGRWKDLLPIRRKLVEVYLETLGSADPQTLEAQQKLAEVLLRCAEVEEATRICRRALAGMEAAFGPKDPRTMSLVVLLIACLDGEQDLEEVLSLRRRLLEDCDPGQSGDAEVWAEMAIDLNNFALQLREQGEYQQAEDYARQALEVDLKVRGEGHPKIAHRRMNLASILMLQAKQEDASKLLAQALDNQSGPPDLTTCRLLYLSAIAALAAGTSATQYYARLKGILSGDALPDHAQVLGNWRISLLFEELTGGLSFQDRQFLQALLDVLNQAAELASLEQFPAWVETTELP